MKVWDAIKNWLSPSKEKPVLEPATKLDGQDVPSPPPARHDAEKSS